MRKLSALPWILALATMAIHAHGAFASWLYASDGNQVVRVDSATGAILGVVVANGPAIHYPGQIVFDRNGTLLVASGNQIVRVDPLAGTVLGTLVAPGSGGLVAPQHLAFGPDGNLLVLDYPSSRNWVVRRYDATTGSSLGSFPVIESGFLWGPVLGPDGNLYLSDHELGAVRRLNGATGAPTGLLVPAGSAPGAYALAFAADGSLYVSCYPPPSGPPILKVFDGTSGLLLRQISPTGLARADSLLVSPDGTIFLTTPDTRPGGIQRLSRSGALSQLVPSSSLPVVYSLAAACNPDVNQVCLLDGRFRAQVDWQTTSGQIGPGRPIWYSDDTDEFWFFGPDNLEMLTKMVDGCGLNQRFWLFAGGLTNVAVTLTVTDTHTGGKRVYHNPQGTAFRPVQDTSAFGGCP